MLYLASVRNLCVVGLAALAFAVPAVAQSPSGYTIIDLGPALGTTSVGYKINASGQVVGACYTVAYPNFYADPHVIFWTGTAFTDLGGGVGYGINSRGQVAGADSPHATLWTGATPLDLGTLGGTRSGGNAVNASGQVAGWAYLTGDVDSHATLWTGNTPLDLGTLGGDTSEAVAINASGQVAGASDTAGDLASYPFRYSNGTMTALGTLGGLSGSAAAINASGQIVGYCAKTYETSSHAVLWTGTTPLDLGTLGGDTSEASDINASGDIVGSSFNANADTVAFLYSKGRMIDLSALLPKGSGWSLTYANGINDNGWITGQGTINGQAHAYILKPKPVTVSGRLALEGVTDLTQTAAPLGAFHVAFRTPGTTTEVYSADVALTTSAGSGYGAFTVNNVPVGVYDVALKGAKNLRAVLQSYPVTAAFFLPPVTLPAGDANDDNSVDTSDFGLLVGSYGSDSSIPGSGYDPTCDFNFDGVVDTADFSLLVGEYGNVGDQ